MQGTGDRQDGYVGYSSQTSRGLSFGTEAERFQYCHAWKPPYHHGHGEAFGATFDFGGSDRENKA